MFYNNYEWTIIFKNCESTYCTPITYMVEPLYFNERRKNNYFQKAKNILIKITWLLSK